MSTETVTATEWKCDNPGCGITRLSDSGLPVGWFYVKLVADAHYCSRDCIEQHVARASVEQRDSGGGWIVSSLLSAEPIA